MAEPVRTGPGLLSDVEQLERQLLAAQEAVAATTATGEAADGLVEATANGRGELTALYLDTRVYREYAPEELAAQIVAAVAMARTNAQQDALATYSAALPGQPAPKGDDLEFGPLLSELERSGNRRTGGAR
ncbi:YbaB/EbfC family nucleoid-associated protein [Kribbella antibiotica]|nr:YbaB/EbfC family nucleoid-associated protein [Kribbella antibiotica]